MNFQNLANRLKNRLGNNEVVADDQGMTDLVDAHLDLVSAAHGSAHGSGHTSGHGSAQPVVIGQTIGGL